MNADDLDRGRMSADDLDRGLRRAEAVRLQSSTEAMRSFSRLSGELAKTHLAMRSLAGSVAEFRAAVEAMEAVAESLEEGREREVAKDRAFRTFVACLVFFPVAVVALVLSDPYGPPLALLWVFLAFLFKRPAAPSSRTTCAYCGAPEDADHMCHLEDH